MSSDSLACGVGLLRVATTASMEKVDLQQQIEAGHSRDNLNQFCCAHLAGKGSSCSATASTFGFQTNTDTIEG